MTQKIWRDSVWIAKSAWRGDDFSNTGKQIKKSEPFMTRSDKAMSSGYLEQQQNHKTRSQHRPSIQDLITSCDQQQNATLKSKQALGSEEEMETFFSNHQPPRGSVIEEGSYCSHFPTTLQGIFRISFLSIFIQPPYVETENRHRAKEIHDKAYS